MKTFNVTLSATYTVNAKDYDGAIKKAKDIAEVFDLGAGFSDIEELDYDPEFDDEAKTPCDYFKDENGMSYCPYEDYGGYESERCRVCCGLGVDEDSYDEYEYDDSYEEDYEYDD